MALIVTVNSQQAGLDRSFYTSDGHIGASYQIFGHDQYIITPNVDTTTKIWNMADGSHRMTLQAHAKGCYGGFIASGFLWTFGDDDTLKKWNLDTGALVSQWPVYMAPRAAYYHSASRVIMTGMYGDLFELNPQTGLLIDWGYTFYPGNMAVYGDMVFVVCESTLEVWSLSSRQLVQSITPISAAAPHDVIVHQQNSSIILATSEYLEFYSYPGLSRYRAVSLEASWTSMRTKMAIRNSELLFSTDFVFGKMSLLTFQFSNIYYAPSRFSTMTLHMNQSFVFKSDGSLQRLDSNNQVVWSTEIGTDFRSTAINDTARLMYTGTGNGKVWEWSLTTGSLLRQMQVASNTPIVRVHQGSVYAVTEYGHFLLLNLKTGIASYIVWVSPIGMTGLVVPSENLLVTSQGQVGIGYRNLSTLNPIVQVPGPAYWITDMQYDATGIYLCTNLGWAQKISFRNATSLWTVRPRSEMCNAVSASSGFAFMGNNGGYLVQLNATTGEPVTIISHSSSNGLCSVLAVPSYVFVSYCSFNSPILQYQYNNTHLRLARSLTGHTNKVTQIIRDGAYIITSSSDSSVRRWFIPELVAAPLPTPKTTTSKTSTMEAVTAETTPEESIPPNTTGSASSADSIVQLATYIFVVALVFVILLALVCIVFLRRRKMKNYMTSITAHPNKQLTQDMNSTTVTNVMATNQTQTLVTQSYGRELSIPAYLELEFGMDFILDDYVASGGGGALYGCEPKSNGLIARIEKYYGALRPASALGSAGCTQTSVLTDRVRDMPTVILDRPAQLIAKCLTGAGAKSSDTSKTQNFLSIEQIMDRQRTSLFQEISLMNLLSTFNNKDANTNDPAKTNLSSELSTKREYFVHLFGFSVRPVCMIMRRYELGDLEQFSLLSSTNWHDHFKDRLPGYGSDTLPYSKKCIIGVLLNVCRALEIMHGLGIAHCDIKPANVLMTYKIDELDGRMELIGVLADFGIARVVKANSEIKKVDAFEVSEVRGLSSYYAAPETWGRFRKRMNSEGNVWLAGDVYAMGITINVLLTRSMPFK